MWSSRACEVRVESVQPPTSASNGTVDCTNSVVVYDIVVIASLSRSKAPGHAGGGGNSWAESVAEEGGQERVGQQVRWTIRRRFSELRRFYLAICQDITAADLRELPPFPSRKLFFGTGWPKTARDATATRRAREILDVLRALLELAESNALALFEAGSVWEDPVRLALWQELRVEDNTYDAAQRQQPDGSGLGSPVDYMMSQPDLCRVLTETVRGSGV